MAKASLADAWEAWLAARADRGREWLRQREIESGQLRVGNRYTWYASIRWSDQAWNVLHPIKLERWIR